jgi:cytochrome b
MKAAHGNKSAINLRYKHIKAAMNSTHLNVKVWDLPTRLFHWSLVLCFAVSWGSIELFDNAIKIHIYAGYTLLSLLIFRLLWGVFGSTTTRFKQFSLGLRPTLGYAKTLLKPRSNEALGHNPLGAWAVVVMLALLTLQVTTGLFANNDLLDSGPLAHFISKDLSDTFTLIHSTVFDFLIAIITIHIVAIFFYRFYKHSDLITAMITGYKTLPNTVNSTHLYFASNLRALLLLLVAIAAVSMLVIYN